MDIRNLLEEVKNGDIDIDLAIDKLKDLPYEDIGYANIDHHRQIRNGYPEVIYCEGKSDEHILGIIKRMKEKGSNILGTRCRKDTYEKVKNVYPNCEYEELSRILKIQNKPIKNVGKGKIVVVTGGTSDIPVADEAYYTAKFLGNEVERVYDVGVAGIHRLLNKMSILKSARVLIVVAGISVVNIDNGFGAGYLAATINKLD